MDSRLEMKMELSKLMHEMLHRNRELFDTGNYDSLLTLCEQAITILSLIDSTQNLTAKEISQQLHVPKTTIVSAVSRLESKGYLEKRQNENDRRENFLLLTPKGRMANREHMEYENLVLESMINMWDDQDQDEVTALLKKRRRLV